MFLIADIWIQSFVHKNYQWNNKYTSDKIYYNLTWLHYTQQWQLDLIQNYFRNRYHTFDYIVSEIRRNTYFKYENFIFHIMLFPLPYIDSYCSDEYKLQNEILLWEYLEEIRRFIERTYGTSWDHSNQTLRILCTIATIYTRLNQ